MITPGDIPRDGHGIMQGAWRLLHRDPEFHGNLVVDFERGEAKAPVSGRRLLGLVSVFGNDLFMEPWGPLPEGFTLPPMVEADVPEEMHAHLERCPWRTASEAAPASTEAKKGEDLTVEATSAASEKAPEEGTDLEGGEKTEGEPAPEAKTAPAADAPADGLDELPLEQLRERAVAAGLVPGNKQEKALIKLLRRSATAPASTEAKKE